MPFNKSTFFSLTFSDALSTCARATRDCNRKAEWRAFCLTHAASIRPKLWPSYGKATRAQAHIDTSPRASKPPKTDRKTGVRPRLSPFVNTHIPVDKVQGCCAFSLPVHTSTSGSHRRLHGWQKRRDADAYSIQDHKCASTLKWRQIKTSTGWFISSKSTLDAHVLQWR